MSRQEAEATVALDGGTRRACNNPDCLGDYGHVETCSDGTYKGQGLLLEQNSTLQARVDALEGGWQPIASAPQDGVFLVYLESELQGSRIVVAKFHPNVKIIGGLFHFDVPKPTHWRPLPAPSVSEDQREKVG